MTADQLERLVAPVRRISRCRYRGHLWSPTAGVLTGPCSTCLGRVTASLDRSLHPRRHRAIDLRQSMAQIRHRPACVAKLRSADMLRWLTREISATRERAYG